MNLYRDAPTCFLDSYKRRQSSIGNDIYTQNTGVETNYKSNSYRSTRCVRQQQLRPAANHNVTYRQSAYKIDTTESWKANYKTPFLQGSIGYRVAAPGLECRQGQQTFTCPNRPPRFKVPRILLLNLHRGSFPRIKRPWREVHHSPPSSAEAEWSYTSIPPYAFMMWTGKTLSLLSRDTKHRQRLSDPGYAMLFSNH